MAEQQGTRENPFSRNKKDCWNHSGVEARWVTYNRYKQYYLHCDVCKEHFKHHKEWTVESFSPLYLPVDVPINSGESKMIGVLFDATVVVTSNGLSTADGKPYPVKSEVVYSERGVYAQDLTTGKAIVLARAIEQKKVAVTSDLTQTIEVKTVQYQ